MKRILSLLIVLTLVSSLASATVNVPEEGVYNGNYLYVYNDSDETVTIQDLPSVFGEISEADTEESTLSVMKVEKRGEDTLYRLTPSLPDMGDMSFFGQRSVSFSLNQVKDDFISFDFTGGGQEEEYISATCLYQTEVCDVFVDNELILSDEILNEEYTTLSKSIGDKFSSDIHSYITENLGSYTGNDGAENGKIIILIQDIKDDFETTRQFTGGYFFEGDPLKVIHIDTNPLMYDTKNAVYDAAYSYETLAHEFTHLVQYAINSNIRNASWFKELFAIYFASKLVEDTSFSDAKNISQDFHSVISNGAVINYPDYQVNSNDVAANYSLLHYFAKYIELRTGEGVFSYCLEKSKTLLSMEDALISGMKIKNPDLSADFDFKTLVRDFYMALTLDEEEGIYSLLGKEKSTEAFSLSMPFAGGTVTLKPGASVVVPLLCEDFTPTVTNGIIYTAFSKESKKTDVSSIDFGADNFTYLSNMLYLTDIDVLINGVNRTLVDYENKVISANSALLPVLYNDVIFIADNKKIIMNKASSMNIRLDISSPVVKVRCQSIWDKDVYDTINIVFDQSETSKNAVSLFEIPKRDQNDYFGRIMLDITEPGPSASTTRPLIIATYDKNGALENLNSFTLNLGKGINRASFTTKNLKLSKDGFMKVFIMGISDNSINPLSNSLKIDFKN